MESLERDVKFVEFAVREEDVVAPSPGCVPGPKPSRARAFPLGHALIVDLVFQAGSWGTEQITHPSLNTYKVSA